MRRPPTLLLIGLAFSACVAKYSARIVGLADGDAISVLTADKTRRRIRLWGVDAPETGPCPLSPPKREPVPGDVS
jgi:endonuclease YncB( thermonuclease family)